MFQNWRFIDVFTTSSGIRQSFSDFYLKYDYSLDRKIVSHAFDMLPTCHSYKPQRICKHAYLGSHPIIASPLEPENRIDFQLLRVESSTAQVLPSLAVGILT